MANGPTKDVKEFQFKVAAQLRIFPQGNKFNIEDPVNLVASASKYGLVFVGTPTGIMSIVSNSILNNQEIHIKSLSVISDFPRRAFPLPSQPTHVQVSADNEFLAVCIRIQDIPVLHIYSVASFGSMSVVKKLEMRMSNTAGVKVFDLQWNPGVPNIIGGVMSDGSVVCFELKDTSYSINSLPPTTHAKCLCWSPKGKQVVIGSADGSLTQYKPDLKPVKTFPPPFPSASIVSVHWPSSFQFIAAYINTSNPHDRLAIAVVNVPKGGQVSFIRYDDVCFGTLSKRPEFYFIHQQVWNVIIVGCGNSMELSVLGSDANTVNWAHWKQDDSTRAELPLTDDKDDVHNLGIALDSSPNQPIQLNDSVSVGPMPVVLSLSHDGVLCWYTTLNLIPGAPSVCSPPQPLPDQSGLSLYTCPIKQMPVIASPVAQVSPAQPASQPTSVFSQPNSIFSLTPSSQGTVAPQKSFSFLPTTTPLAAPSLGQPSLSSSFSTPSQPPSLFATASPFSQPTQLHTPTTSTTQVLAPSFPTISQPSPQQPALQPLSAFSISNQANNSAPSDASTKPLIPPSTVSFMGLNQQSSLFSQSLGQTKVAENTSIVQPTLTLGREPVKKEEPKIEVKIVPEATPTPINQTSPSKKTKEKPSNVESDRAAYMVVIHHEMSSFQEEFSGVKQYLSSLKVEVGEDKVKGELNEKLDKHKQFSKELVATTQVQSAEVSSLRLSLLDILCWIQLIKTKQKIKKNPSLIEMKEVEYMDPIGKHLCKQIEQRLYNLKSQVSQALVQIESIKNSGKGGLYLPTYEIVLQATINQNKTLCVLKGVVSNIEEKLSDRVKRFQHKKKKIIQLERSARNKSVVNDSQLSTLAQKLLQTKLESTGDESYSFRESSQKMIAKGIKNRSQEVILKENLLRDWHKNHKIIYNKVSPLHLSILSSDFNTPTTPLLKSNLDKRPINFTSGKVETPVAHVVKPVASTPVSRMEKKPNILSRNLFANSILDSSITEAETITQDENIKQIFKEGVTSTPITPAIKTDLIKPNILPSTQAPPAFSISHSIKSEKAPSPDSSSVPLKTGIALSVIPAGPPQISPTPTVKATTAKAIEIQCKPLEQSPKVVSFNMSNTPSVFSFGNVAFKDNKATSDSPAPTSVTSSISPPGLLKPVTNIFRGLTQQTDKPESSSTDESNTVSFNFGSMSSSLKGAPVVAPEKTAPLPKESAATIPSTVAQTFSFSLGSSSCFSAPVTTSFVNSPLFSFNQNVASPVSLGQMTTPVSSITSPLSSFSLNPVSSPTQAPVVVHPIVTSSSPSTLPLSPSGTVPVSSTTVAAVALPTSAIPPVSSSLPLTVTPVSVSPIVTSGSILGQPTTSTTFSAIPVTSSAVKPAAPVSTAFSTLPTTTAASSPASTAATTTATFSSFFNTSQTTFGSSSFNPESSATPIFNSSAFGSFTPTTSAPSMFGAASLKFSTPTTSAPSPSVFGQPTSTAAPSATPFSQVTSTASSPFGQTVTTTPSQASPFSPTVPTQSTTSSPFSQASTTFTTTASSFGGSAFGSTPAFSPLATNTFGGGSTFGTPTTTPSVFGTPTTTASSLFNTPMFGQTTQTTASPFGVVSCQASPFGAAAPATQAPSSPFGASPPTANPFFSQSQSSVFGQSSTGGNFGSSGGSIFGGSSSFGAGTQGGQFQQPGCNIFGGGSAGGPFSPGGGQTVGQAGFGAPPAFQTPPKSNSGGFGSAPVFGSSPSFGGAPAFGTSPSFGSPNKVFGSTSPVAPAAGFGTPSANVFENLANQNTMSFGNLAQTQPQGMTSTFGARPPQQQNPPSFGGNAFNSWR